MKKRKPKHRKQKYRLTYFLKTHKGEWLYKGHAFAGNFRHFNFFGISGFSVFRIPKQVRYKGPSFESPKISRNLPKIFPKILTENN